MCHGCVAVWYRGKSVRPTHVPCSAWSRHAAIIDGNCRQKQHNWVNAMNEHRIEHNTMGEVRLPKTAYYGAQTQRAVENFPSLAVHCHANSFVPSAW